MRVEVCCYAGHRGEQTPRTLRFGAREVAVERVIDQWIGSEQRYFKVIGADQAIYILRHDTSTHLWEVILYDRRAQS